MKGAVIKRMVLDASVAVAWCFEDESSDFTEGVLDLLASGTEALAPAVWPLELVNALLMAERRKRITVAQVTALLRRIAVSVFRFWVGWLKVPTSSTSARFCSSLLGMNRIIGRSCCRRTNQREAMLGKALPT